MISNMTDDLCFQIQRAARVAARCFDEELRRVDLTNGQFILLMLLNCPEPPGMSDLSSRLSIDRTTLTAALKPLERRGLVRIDRSPIDLRVKQMLLTSRGIDLLRRAFPIWEEARLRLEARVSERDLRKLQSTLHVLFRHHLLSS
jgi:DNA-binding MarR family transcriptional regulator